MTSIPSNVQSLSVQNGWNYWTACFFNLVKIHGHAYGKAGKCLEARNERYESRENE